MSKCKYIKYNTIIVDNLNKGIRKVNNKPKSQFEISSNNNIYNDEVDDETIDLKLKNKKFYGNDSRIHKPKQLGNLKALLYFGNYPILVISKGCI